jgi:hypothetical protein
VIQPTSTSRKPARFSLHDLPIEITCDVPGLDAEIARVLGPYRVPGGFTGRAYPTSGVIRPYVEAEVVRRLPPRARRVVVTDAAGELYEDGERFWMIDDRIGMVEINLLKSQWRAWLLPHPRTDAVRRAEAAVLWPMAQLLRMKGLHLLPAASVVRNGFGILLLSPVDVTPELTSLVRAGCRVVGQRWTALREQDGRVEMLHLPGVVDRACSPHVRLMGCAAPANSAWVDLSRQHLTCEQRRATCDGVFVIARGRRPAVHLRPLNGDAQGAISAAWPIAELHPLRRHGQLPAKLAATCACYDVALSRDPDDVVGLLGALPARGTGITLTTYVKGHAGRGPQRATMRAA